MDLQLGSLSQIASDDPNAIPSPMQWEQQITVPVQEFATQHFLRKSAEEQTDETKP